MEDSINLLNDDILMRVFDYLHFDDKIRLRRTCFRWKRLIDYQLGKVKALRLGHFGQGGYCITSGLQMPCDHKSSNHRRHTGTLFGDRLNSPIDLETRCYSINRYDYLHRALKICSHNITMLSLGNLNITYRLLIVLTHNLPNLEHLEIMGCASLGPHPEKRQTLTTKEDRLPSVESFNSRTQDRDTLCSMLLYNQHNDEQVNMQQRLMRASMVKSCELVKESRKYWPCLRHLLVKDCNLLNEFSLSLIMAISSQTLEHLVLESNQYVTGEFLNYCGPNLKILRIKYCPLLQLRFLEDLMKLRQLLVPARDQDDTMIHHLSSPSSTLQSHPQPINTFMLKNYRNFNQDLYCTL